jgi:predicted O-methyltransferase YrrM
VYRPETKLLPETAFDASYLLVKYRSTEVYQFFNELNAGVSMLHPDVLALLYHLGSVLRGPAIEFGPYISGSTIAFATGARDSGRTGTVLTTVEIGGRSEHPTLPVADIVKKLQENLDLYRVAPMVRVLVGDSRADSVRREIRAEGARAFDALIMDSDGHVLRDFELYSDALTPRAFLVVDDYFSPGAPDKELTTKAELDQLERMGTVQSLGVHGWGTWFGRLR